MGVVVVVGRRRSGDALERRASLVRRVIAEGWVGVRGFRMGMGNVEYVSWWFEEEKRYLSATSFDSRLGSPEISAFGQIRARLRANIRTEH